MTAAVSTNLSTPAGAVLVFDVGSTRVRGALMAGDGRMVADRSIASPVAETACEADPALWWDAIANAAAELAAQAAADRIDIRAVAISGLTRTQVLLDAAGQIVRPALLLSDARSSDVLDQVRAGAPRDHPETAELNAFHPLTRLVWLAAAEPAAFARIARVLDPKDYLNFRLTGRIGSDAISLARLQASASVGPDGRSLLAHFGMNTDLVPPLQAPLSVCGHVQAGLDPRLAALVGVPVVTMAHDTWASVVGLGALRSGFAYNLTGTTEVFGLLSARPASAPGLLSLDWGQGLTQIGGPSLSGGDTIAWLQSVLGAGAAPLAPTSSIAPTSSVSPTSSAILSASLAAMHDPTRIAAAPVFLPYLRGERVPHWDPALRGAWIGLERRHGTADLTYAVFEAIACLNRVVLERAEAAAGLTAAEVRFGGGGAANAAWCQIKADMLGRPVLVPNTSEPGLVGAARAAWTAICVYPDLAAAQAGEATPATVYRPDAARRTLSDERYALFVAADAAIGPLSRRWTAARSP